MKFSHLSCRFRALILCGLLSLDAGASANAHGPFAHSAQLTIGINQLELVVTMGSDATRDFLAQSGLSAGELATLSPSPPPTPRLLPADLAGRIFIARVDETDLKASSVSVRTEGLESLFTLIYPRPGNGILNLNATYFNGIEPMKRGDFVALDENGQIITAAFLSRTTDSVQLSLPPIINAGETIVVSQTAVPPGTTPVPSDWTVSRGKIAVLAAAVPALALILLFCRRWHRQTCPKS